MDTAERFLALHQRPNPLLLMPNPWDIGSAKLMASLGFAALATTSSGFAGTLGRLDGSVTRDEVLEHAASLAAAVEVPVSADLENCFADDPEGVADTVSRAAATGLAGCSVEDFTGRHDEPIYERALAVERVAAAAEAAHAGPSRLVLTARAEGLLHRRPDLGEIIERLQGYQEAGADVLFAPGLRTIEDIASIVDSVDRPVSVLAPIGGPSIAELAAAGVRRVSTGGALAYAALGAAVEAVLELRDHGSYGFAPRAKVGYDAARSAFR